MAKDEGLIIHFDEEQRKDLIKGDNEGANFSDALSVPDWEMKQLQVVLLSFSGTTIDYICLAKKGSRVATAKSRVEFYDLVELDNVKLSEIEEKLGVQKKLVFVKSSSGQGGRIPTKTWVATLEILKELRTYKKSEIERLISLKSVSKYTFGGGYADQLSQEREALGAALDIFSGSNILRKEVLSSWAPNIEDVKDLDDGDLTATLSINDMQKSSFISGIASRHIQEESALQHDLVNWEGESAQFHEMGVSSFQQGSRILDIVYANKNSLEHTLGVDLIYYNQEFHSFVLVQYKLMKDKSDAEGYYYRPDGQLEKELARMDEFSKQYPADSEINSHEQYRLNPDGFLFKMVPCRGVQAASSQLISGMYITREYMQFLLGNGGPKGKNGGRIISFKNSPRYLTNTEFSSSVNRGWIGSKMNQSDILEKIVKVFLETGRAIIVAVERETANKSNHSDSTSAPGV
ncbi:hypothetical protein LCGC14_0193190 [marine sediment metagenome]|uniref:Uncharacterized protein n=1 Tax=marine sediment metagenome TaxID=412755 RepID=A0A0F9V2B1_9ZZZZ|nr:hypothetical protein [Halomonas sp.]HDZ45394.1 hypothetical protein [Halomonas sp.]|tara:strand:- start:360 stop:1745 length:1386 start_codon:yes stop_codon:yes gene_type:complete